MKNKVRFSAFIFFLILTLGPNEKGFTADDAALPGGFGVSLGPSQVRVISAPGESRNESIRVWNKSNHAMTFSVDIADVGNRVDQDGNLVRDFVPAGTLPYSCAPWILLQEKQFSLEAGTHRDFTILLSAPADETGGKAAIIFFTGAPTTEPQSGADANQPTASVSIQPRLGVLIFYEIENTVQRAGVIENFEVKLATDEEALVMNYTFENTGNTDILVSGSFYILDEAKTLAAKDDITTMRTFPGDRGVSQTRWEGYLAPGNYHLVASFELGPNSETVIVKESDFSVSE